MPFEPREPDRNRRQALLARILGSSQQALSPLNDFFSGGNYSPETYGYSPFGFSNPEATTSHYTPYNWDVDPYPMPSGSIFDSLEALLGIGGDAAYKGFMMKPQKSRADVGAGLGLGIGVSGADQRRGPNLNRGIPGSDAGYDWSLFNRLVREAENVPQVDFNDLIRSNVSAIKKSYKPQLGALRRENRITEREAGETENLITHLYGAMGRRLGRTAGRQEKLAETEKKQISTQEANQLASSNKSYLKQAEKTAKLLRNMGQEEAAAEIITKAQQASLNAAETIQSEAKFERGQAEKSGDVQEKFFNRLRQGANLEGNQAVTDLMQQKADILAENRNQMAALRGARGKEIAGIRTSLEQAEAEQNVSADQMVYDRLMGLAGMKLNIEDFLYGKERDRAQMIAQLRAQQAEMAADQQGLTGPSAFEEALPGNYQAAMTILQQLNPRMQARAASDFNSFLGSQKVMTGKTVGPDDQPINYSPEQMANDIKQQALNEGYSPEQAQILWLAALRYAS